MKIVHISQLYYPSIGGNQAHVTSLSEHLIQRGEEVIVYTANAVELTDILRKPSKDKLLPVLENINGVRVRRFRVSYGLRRFIFKYLHGIRGGYRLLNFIFRDFLEYWNHGPITLGMFTALMKEKPDLVMVSNNFVFQSVIGYWAKKWLKIPFVFIPITHTFHPFTHHPALKKILQYADLVIACTAFEKNFLIGQGIEADKILVVPLGINYQQWIQAPKSLNVREQYGLGRDFVVGYLGRKSEGKGVEHLIQSMRIVWQKFPNARLLLVGKTEETFKKDLEVELNQLTQDELSRIVMVNDLKDKDKKSFYAAMDVFVMVSHIDSFGLVYLEAWATGVPVIAAKGTPQEDFLDEEKDGLLVEYANPAALAKAIEKLMSDQCLRQEMGDRGSFKVESRLNMEVHTQEIRRVYYKLVHGNINY